MCVCRFVYISVSASVPYHICGSQKNILGTRLQFIHYCTQGLLLFPAGHTKLAGP